MSHKDCLAFRGDAATECHETVNRMFHRLPAGYLLDHASGRRSWRLDDGASGAPLPKYWEYICKWHVARLDPGPFPGPTLELHNDSSLRSLAWREFSNQQFGKASVMGSYYQLTLFAGMRRQDRQTQGHSEHPSPVADHRAP